MRGVALTAPVQRWSCPNCHVTAETRGESNRYHRCRGAGIFAGLFAPMVRAGTAAKVTVREREDYVAGERVQLHQGRPIMSVITTRDDGQDCTVFAPAARLIGAA